MEQVFTRNLTRELTQRIKGVIKVHIVSDTLVVEILDRDTHLWRFTHPGVALPLSLGLTSTTMACVIVKEYRKYIIHKYFR